MEGIEAHISKMKLTEFDSYNYVLFSRMVINIADMGTLD